MSIINVNNNGERKLPRRAEAAGCVSLGRPAGGIAVKCLFVEKMSMKCERKRGGDNVYGI